MLLFISLAMIACGSEDDKKDSSSKSKNSSRNQWDNDVEEDFQKNYCQRATENECNCFMSEFSKDYSYKEFDLEMQQYYKYIDTLYGPDMSDDISNDELESMEKEVERLNNYFESVLNACAEQEAEERSSSGSNRDFELTIREIVKGAQTYHIEQGELPPDCWETLMDYGYVQWSPEFDSSSFECFWDFDDVERSIVGSVYVYSGDDVCVYDIASEDFFCK